MNGSPGASCISGAAAALPRGAPRAALTPRSARKQPNGLPSRMSRSTLHGGRRSRARAVLSQRAGSGAAAGCAGRCAAASSLLMAARHCQGRPPPHLNCRVGGAVSPAAPPPACAASSSSCNRRFSARSRDTSCCSAAPGLSAVRSITIGSLPPLPPLPGGVPGVPPPALLGGGGQAGGGSEAGGGWLHRTS